MHKRSHISGCVCLTLRGRDPLGGGRCGGRSALSYGAGLWDLTKHFTELLSFTRGRGKLTPGDQGLLLEEA
ncbi:hypothetical protein Pmani_007521 [Petrolisthes manimaculis]|uniref:Uncharacterized protein n=1 Tax=Petrolisthes manimaculis TaxID=1843537 RepID=A0AAE1Q8E8_9EUCA|nr:hypothetical protein Pmani_007521 [Petrolisthes manimaculis]